MNDGINEYIRTSLMYLGMPEAVFSYADPMTILTFFLFSSRIMAFLAAVFVWLFVIFIKFLRAKSYDDPFDRGNVDYEIHQYDMNNMHRMYNMDKKPSALFLFFKGFALPVTILFIMFTVAFEVYKNFGNMI